MAILVKKLTGIARRGISRAGGVILTKRGQHVNEMMAVAVKINSDFLCDNDIAFLFHSSEYNELLHPTGIVLG